ncbi:MULTISPECIES: hypothetical protein [Rhodobacterales]|jgi:hypothetical protein|uniref:hypothetical protein n=1 Tax=Rhodobacterales TaxID=204455 RepID=UPI00119BCD3D|nr:MULTISPECIES: hypothetical protein [Rhodobacterales]WJY20364.1 hypothetical protein QTA57_10835 [Fontisubflavum oceani]
MKAFIASLVIGVFIAGGASFVLNGNFQVDAHTAFTTEGARVGNPGDNLINY